MGTDFFKMHSIDPDLRELSPRNVRKLLTHIENPNHLFICTFVYETGGWPKRSRSLKFEDIMPTSDENNSKVSMFSDDLGALQKFKVSSSLRKMILEHKEARNLQDDDFILAWNHGGSSLDSLPFAIVSRIPESWISFTVAIVPLLTGE